MRLYALSFVTLLGMAACNTIEVYGELKPRPAVQSAEEIAFAKEILNALQLKSIEKNREYCGYIGLDTMEGFEASKPTKGRKGSCVAKAVSDDFNLIASFHTHGAYMEKYDSEIPSYDDLSSDIEEGVDGYISTPGGRLWFSDSRKEEVRLLCGQNCLIADPNYQAEADLNISKSYTLDQLAEH